MPAPPPCFGVSISLSARPAALPGAHSQTAANMRPGPPSRPRTRRRPACPRNTGAWLRLQNPRPQKLSLQPPGPSCRPATPTAEGTGNRQKQLPAGSRGLQVPRGRARRKWAHVRCRASAVCVREAKWALKLRGSAPGRRRAV